MGNFSEHIEQSKRNISFLSQISVSHENCWDWQVTVCFYAALHMINAHIYERVKCNYLSHKRVDDSINPFYQLSPSKLDEKAYLAYTKLYQLSRRSRYLLNENAAKGESSLVNSAAFTNDRHFRKAVRHLEDVMRFIEKNHNVSFSKGIKIKCIELREAQDLTFFVAPAI